MLRPYSAPFLVLLASACATEPQPDVEPRGDFDGKISAHVAQIISAHDADGDGALSQPEAERNPWLAAHFQEADLDADGKVTAEEAFSLAQEMHAAHCDTVECDPHASPQEHVRKVFADLDTDGDRFVTPEEAEGHLLEHVFAQVDADADGRVSADELRTFADVMHGGHDGPHAHP